MNTAELWLFLPVGYLLTVAVETPVLVLPALFADSSRAVYLLAAETFAPAAECLLFWLAFGREKAAESSSLWRDFAAITAANLLSFLAGEAAGAYSWFGLLG